MPTVILVFDISVCTVVKMSNFVQWILVAFLFGMFTYGNPFQKVGMIECFTRHNCGSRRLQLEQTIRALSLQVQCFGNVLSFKR